MMNFKTTARLFRRLRAKLRRKGPLRISVERSTGEGAWLIKANFHVEDGLVWPNSDDQGPGGKQLRSSDMDIALKNCRDTRSVIQAGGHCGIWALALSERFQAVYTFEPDGENFSALAMNTAEKGNIIRIQAALGDSHALVDLSRKPGKTGAHFVAGAGLIPTFRIDDLVLEDCDLLVLDIEGSEMAALRGAEETIKRSHPVIMFEDKGHSRRYGVEPGAVENWLATRYEYRVIARPKRDIIMVSDGP